MDSQTFINLSTIIQSQNLTGFALASLVASWVYDCFLILDQEVSLIHRPRWSKGTILYITTRYMPALMLSVHLCTNQDTEVNYLPNENIVTCRILQSMWYCTAALCITGAEGIFILRTYALWGQNKFILGLMLSTALSLIILNMIIALKVWKQSKPLSVLNLLAIEWLPEKVTDAGWLRLLHAVHKIRIPLARLRLHNPPLPPRFLPSKVTKSALDGVRHTKSSVPDTKNKCVLRASTARVLAAAEGGTFFRCAWHSVRLSISQGSMGSLFHGGNAMGAPFMALLTPDLPELGSPRIDGNLFLCTWIHKLDRNARMRRSAHIQLYLVGTSSVPWDRSTGQ
ncbi:hypothetical protein BDR06DRAFT_968803 [Suillus hirtellus]|nr:hypothetical protein BDR06DRAFT_968803 [Suillus hirtellus]